MIYPYLVGPMTVTGFFWSQGECNADNNETAFYACAFGPFMDSWRQEFRTPAHFNGPNAFFGFELLPAYIQDGPFSPASLPVERAAQLTGLTTATLDNVMVVNAIVRAASVCSCRSRRWAVSLGMMCTVVGFVFVLNTHIIFMIDLSFYGM